MSGAARRQAGRVRATFTDPTARTAVRHVDGDKPGAGGVEAADAGGDGGGADPGMGWQDRGLCAQTDPEAFFPEKGGSVAAAKRVCQQCEVRAACLEFALENGERFGVWGGLDERERRKLSRERQGRPAA